MLRGFVPAARRQQCAIKLQGKHPQLGCQRAAVRVTLTQSSVRGVLRQEARSRQTPTFPTTFSARYATAFSSAFPAAGFDAVPSSKLLIQLHPCQH